MPTPSASTESPRANLALGLAVAAVVLFVIAAMQEEGSSEWLWPVAGLLGGVAAAMGWQAGRRGKTLLATVLGGLVFLAILGWIVWAASTGNL